MNQYQSPTKMYLEALFRKSAQLYCDLMDLILTISKAVEAASKCNECETFTVRVVKNLSCRFKK